MAGLVLCMGRSPLGSIAQLCQQGFYGAILKRVAEDAGFACDDDGDVRLQLFGVLVQVLHAHPAQFSLDVWVIEEDLLLCTLFGCLPFGLVVGLDTAECQSHTVLHRQGGEHLRPPAVCSYECIHLRDVSLRRSPKIEGVSKVPARFSATLSVTPPPLLLRMAAPAAPPRRTVPPVTT